VRTTRARGDESLLELTRGFVHAWEGEHEENRGPAADAALSIREFRYPDRRVAVFDSTGRLVALSDTTPLSPALTRKALGDAHNGPAAALVRAAATRGAATRGAAFATLEGSQDGPPVRAHVQRVMRGSQPFTVLALRSLRAEDDASESFTTTLSIVIPIVLIFAAVGGYLLARASLAPVVAMGQTAKRISASNLDERLPVRNPRDELGGLAQVLNGLLSRLESAFAQQQRAADQQRQFMADASHELRTPVAALSSVADVALARADRDPAELVEALDVVRGEARRLARLVDDLMLLARADAGELPMRPEPLFLEEIVHDSARAARGLAAARNVALVAPPADEAPFTGDSHLLRRAVMILLDNAIKYTPSGGTVHLTLARRDGRYEIIVEDTGPGVSPEAAERIFERFYTEDVARTRASGGDGNAGGAGLGRSIARWIVEAHRGTVRLDNTSPAGSRFVITLPVEPEPAQCPGDSRSTTP
jgi:signal transduction histidine kinase